MTLLPDSIMGNRDLMQALAEFSEPLVRITDKLVRRDSLLFLWRFLLTCGIEVVRSVKFPYGAPSGHRSRPLLPSLLLEGPTGMHACMKCLCLLLSGSGISPLPTRLPTYPPTGPQVRIAGYGD